MEIVPFLKSQSAKFEKYKKVTLYLLLLCKNSFISHLCKSKIQILLLYYYFLKMLLLLFKIYFYFLNRLLLLFQIYFYFFKMLLLLFGFYFYFLKRLPCPTLMTSSKQTAFNLCLPSLSRNILKQD